MNWSRAWKLAAQRNHAWNNLNTRFADIALKSREDAVLAERERCAKLAEGEADCRCGNIDGAELAARIRSGK